MLTNRTLTYASGLVMATMVATAPANALPDDNVTVNVAEEGRGVYTLRGSFTVPAEPSNVWKVLTDYGQMSDFIPSVRSSIVKKDGTDSILVSQETTSWFLAIPKKTRVMLQVQEDPFNRIDFVDVSQQDFDQFKGSWQVEKTASGTRVDYVASAKPKIYLPVWGRSIGLDMVKGLMRDLRKEIMRRPI
ncbi:MAG TPA: SRPBCC family protein [Stenomitos sp.]